MEFPDPLKPLSGRALGADEWTAEHSHVRIFRAEYAPGMDGDPERTADARTAASAYPRSDRPEMNVALVIGK